MRRTDPLIVGGGPAGAAAAIMLARGGARPLLIERDRVVADHLCGGFLSWRTLATLAELGVMPNGAPVDRLRLFANGRMVERALPGRAIGLSRRALDTALLTRAEAEGAAIERGVTARAIAPDGVRTGDGAMLLSDAIFLATGKQDLRGAARPRTAGDPVMGLRLHLAPPPRRIDGAIELHLVRGGYAGIVMQEDGRANFCMAIAKSRLTEAGGDVEALFTALADDAPALGERLSWRTGSPVEAIAAVPYGWRARTTLPGRYRLGDQAGVIPSLAGEGIGIALASGRSAAAAWAAGADAPGWQAAFDRRIARPIRVAGAIRRLGERPATASALTLVARSATLVEGAARATRVRD